MTAAQEAPRVDDAGAPLPIRRWEIPCSTVGPNPALRPEDDAPYVSRIRNARSSRSFGRPIQPHIPRRTAPPTGPTLPTPKLQLAILFWFYKDLPLCENRVRLLRRHNPDAKIFGLYGGDPADQEVFRRRLHGHLDDFYCFETPQSAEWKWRNGDLLITEWYRQRGQSLDWDSVFIVQWDMLVMAAVDDLFPGLRQGSIVLSAVRPIQEAAGWFWRDDPTERSNYDRFLTHVRHRYDPVDDPLWCIFIIAVLSREFLHRYSQVSEPELGFLEYRLPTYAQIFGIDVVQAEGVVVHAPGRSRSEVVLTVGDAIPLPNVARNLVTPSGARIFHPFRDPVPETFLGWVVAVLKKLLRGGD